MKRFTPFFLLLIIAGSFRASAQMLETIDMSSQSSNYNTYVTGINNEGYITGYYAPPSGSNVGFIITPSGKKLLINPSFLGATDTKVESINDHGVAIVTATGGPTSFYKCYLANDTIANIVALTNVQQTSAVPLDINNNNDITGWYQAAQRWLYVQHDSIVPGGNTAWEAARFESAGPTYYNTWGTGINDANDVIGYYIDGTYYPFKYDNLTGTFTAIPYGGFQIKPCDISNNNWIAGEYRQTNGFWMGFYAYLGTGTITQWHSLDNIFDNNTIQSVVNGINNNQEVAGSFLHPDGHWVGFVYRPNVGEYRIPDFAYNVGTWPMNNNSGSSNTVWPSSYWGTFNYTQMDPYVNNGMPLIDAYLQANYLNLNSLTPATSVDWKTFCAETDLLNYGASTIPYMQNYYHSVAKHDMFAKYVNHASPYNGHCYGVTYTTLLHHFDDALFSSWFNFTPGTDISQINNSDDNAVHTIARMYLRQSDINTISKYATAFYQTEGMWNGLHKLKTEYMKPFSESNPRSLSFKFSNGFHSVLPYKIRSPRTLPFDVPTLEYDTVFIHDSNYPQDSTQHFLVNSTKLSNPHSAVSNTNYNPVSFITFNKISIRELMDVSYTQLKSTSSDDLNQELTFATDGPSYYTINTGTGEASSNGSGYNNTSTDLIAMNYENTTNSPAVAHTMDTSLTASFHTYNYNNQAMMWRQSNKRYSMGISRTAIVSESDNGSVQKRVIAYGNPDNVTKYLTASYTQTTDNQMQGVSILATNICAAQGDSIVTENTAPFVYKITKVTGTTNCIYDLTVFAAYNGDSIKEFHSPVELNGTTTHTIDPYFVGTNGTQIAVIIDNGNDGTTDDTLFIAGFPLGMKPGISKDGIKVYPNPVSDKLSIELAGNYDNYDIRLSDIVGKVVYTTTGKNGKLEVPMNTFAPGMYLLQITDNKGNILYLDKVTKQ